MKSMQKGFTLIELMIVVAIIAILAAIAIPQYQTYVIKSQFTRVMAETGDQKVTIEDCLNNGLTMATTPPCSSTATSSDLIQDAGNVPKLTINADGTASIIGTFGNKSNPALSGTVQWTRTASGSWSCGTSITSPTKYAPVSCQGPVGTAT